MAHGKIWASITMALGLVATSAPIASAQDSNASTVAPTMVILDASGSMIPNWVYDLWHRNFQCT
ncbi:hypothetical protein [Corynebacterium ammoniagenes]|uniref:VWA domain-containing protein n=1 Tax=Corynebacterium ammoniagenes DSM 20306 TaxID=649754 RepID=A0ABP2IBW8_CORAM|nr:hypothetical protein [Corynebacterium ammoniagenes]EFG81043.1 hypothetical protein HMPREF0281_01683 [Corynebacterium ammoniagenes DSM 20306]